MVWVNSIPKPPNLAEIGFYIFVKGLPRTLILTVLGLLGGFVIGLSLAIMRLGLGLHTGGGEDERETHGGFWENGGGGCA